MNIERKAQIGLFYEELQNKINEAWQAGSASFSFNSTLASGIEYVCFINVSADSSGADSFEKEVKDYAKYNRIKPEINLLLWPIKKAAGLERKTIEHIRLPDSNPYCIAVVNGKISFRIEKDMDEALPTVI